MSRKIVDIDVDEISLVDTAATLKKFAIRKRREFMDELIELLKSILGEDESLTEEAIAKAKELPEDAMKAIKGALNLLNKYKADFPADVLGAIKTLAKYASYGYPAKKAADPDFVEELLSVEKAGARLSKATIEQLKKIAEIVNEMLGSKEKNLTKDFKGDLSPEVVAKLEKLAQLEEAEKLRLKKEADEKEKIKEKEITDLKERIEKLEKKKIKKKSIEGQEGDDDGGDDDDDEDTNNWPSLTSAEEED